MVIPCISSCISELTDLVVKSPEILRIRACLVKSLRDRYKGCEINDILRISTLLDPRFKTAGFTSTQHANEAVSCLNELVEEAVSMNHEPLSMASSETSRPLAKKSKTDFLSDVLAKHVSRRSEITQTNNQVKHEIDSYLNLVNLPIREDIIQWWFTRKDSYPNLYKLAVKFLSIPATSATSERVFSVAGNILNEKRSSLSGDHLDMLIFLNKHYDLW